MTDQIFSDGFTVSFVGNMLRIDLFALSPTAKDGQGRPSPEFRAQVVMTPDAFVRSFASIQDLLKQLAERGVVKIQPAAKEAAAKPAPATVN
jgi:hypothetical protein